MLKRNCFMLQAITIPFFLIKKNLIHWFQNIEQEQGKENICSISKQTNSAEERDLGSLKSKNEISFQIQGVLWLFSSLILKLSSSLQVTHHERRKERNPRLICAICLANLSIVLLLFNPLSFCWFAELS